MSVLTFFIGIIERLQPVITLAMRTEHVSIELKVTGRSSGTGIRVPPLVFAVKLSLNPGILLGSRSGGKFL